MSRPAMICSDKPGTWAFDTMSRRVNEEILERTVNDMADDLAKPEFQKIRDSIEQLRKQLQESSTLPKLEDPHDVYDTELNKEVAEWRSILAAFETKTWLTAPWLISEFYVYRRLMQALDYWNPVSPGYKYDPFQKAKTAGLVNSVDSAELCLSRVPDLPSTPEGLALAVGFALWGNHMDLSLWPAGHFGHKLTDVWKYGIRPKLEDLHLSNGSSALLGTRVVDINGDAGCWFASVRMQHGILPNPSAGNRTRQHRAFGLYSTIILKGGLSIGATT